ncbi:MAG TPA: DUF3303 family protein [Candidatus Acidoferrum sp.]|nr:DUF3303 family protein [Candidatus Acidoferrum sp.]
MLLLAEYRLKPHIAKADFKCLMDEFAKRGSEQGEVAHYVKADASGGYTIEEMDTLAHAFEGSLAYSEFMTFTVTPVLKIDDAVGPILTYLGG